MFCCLLSQDTELLRDPEATGTVEPNLHQVTTFLRDERSARVHRSRVDGEFPRSTLDRHGGNYYPLAVYEPDGERISDDASKIQEPSSLFAGKTIFCESLELPVLVTRELT